jgi:poly-gamma-glutamate capsule biosynthesis protein CapA/YwtB (metallophosphatase superfamily)
MYNGSLAIAGEFMCNRPFSMRDEPEFLELIKVLREADTTYCHLEINIFEKGGYPGRPFAVSAMQADPVIANEMKWAGIDLVSCAFNHALDWGLPGMLGTIETLDKAGIVHAGTGNNLEEAREPAYFESKAGRVAVVSISSGHHPYDSASPVKAPVN